MLFRSKKKYFSKISSSKLRLKIFKLIEYKICSYYFLTVLLNILFCLNSNIRDLWTYNIVITLFIKENASKLPRATFLLFHEMVLTSIQNQGATYAPCYPNF